jgi:hypothetical protein
MSLAEGIPASVLSRLAERLEFGDGEQFIRGDVSLAYGNQIASPRLAMMIITTRRVLFCPPATPRGYRFKAWLATLMIGNRVSGVPSRTYRVKMRPPMGKRIEIPLAAVTKLWKWKPEFSSPPMIQTTRNGISYWVMVDEYPWKSVADDISLREHFEALQSTWMAARQP